MPGSKVFNVEIAENAEQDEAGIHFEMDFFLRVLRDLCVEIPRIYSILRML